MYLSNKKIRIDKKLQECWIREMNMGWNKSSGEREGFYFYQEAAKFGKGGVVLDAGAGQLRFKPFFEKSIYISQEHTTGIELKGMKNIEYDLINPLDKKIPLQDNCLDAVLSNSTLEHIRYPEKFFAEAYRVLKPGGRIYISVPFIALEHEIPYDFQRPTRYGLERWLSDANFTNIKIEASSTCVQGIISYLSVAIVYDLLQTKENPKKVFLYLLKSKNGLIKVIKKLPIFLYAGLAYLFIKILVSIIGFFSDVEVYPNANMPSGWLASADKPGKYQKRNYKNKEKFLKAYKIN